MCVCVCSVNIHVCQLPLYRYIQYISLCMQPKRIGCLLMALTYVYLLNGAVLHQYCSCKVLTFNYYGLPLKPLLMKGQVLMVSVALLTELWQQLLLLMFSCACTYPLILMYTPCIIGYTFTAGHALDMGCGQTSITLEIGHDQTSFIYS